jgi:hypothetical protein
MAKTLNPVSNATKYHFDFTPPSRVKMPWTVLAETIQCLWRSFYYTVFHSKVDVSNLDDTGRKDVNFTLALRRLKKIDTLSDKTIMMYLEGLSQESKGRVGVVLGHAVKDEKQELPEHHARELLFIPIVIKGFLRDHVVLLTVNFDTETVDYFDPQGLTIAERPDATAISGKKLTDIVTEAAVKYFSDKAITSKTSQAERKPVLIESTVRQQEDWYNCGMHVLDFAARYAEDNATFEDLIKRENRLTENDANDTKRKAFIEQLLTWYPPKEASITPAASSSAAQNGPDLKAEDFADI